MNSIAQVESRSAFGGSPAHDSRNNSMMQPFTSASESVPADPMDITSPASASMGPPVNSSPEIEQGGNMNGNIENNTGMHSGTGAAAMAASQGPKVVQTAFIHKLYNMLEDRTIQHLISWSNTNESFVMSPSNEFSKVLAQYFKHTNISSFVRQLNMYGFHKVSDVFHSGSPDSTLWEFRHGNGNFKKGDLVGLREIKRRASRHALIHRDSFSGHKAMPSQPGAPAEPVPDTLEQRMVHMEHAVYRMNQRMSRTDDSLAMLTLKCQSLTEGLVRCHHWTHGLSSHVQSLAPGESSLYVEISNMQKEIARQLEMVRSLDNPHEALLAGRQPYFSNMSLDPHPPFSPRHLPFDESRRSSAQMPEPPAISISHGYVGRSSILPASPRSYGGVSNHPNHNTSPKNTFNRPPPPPIQRPPIGSTIIQDDSPNLARRHTSADIRETHGWPPNLPPLPQLSHSLNVNPNNTSPYISGNNSSSAWPSSPHRTSTNTNPNPNAGSNQPNLTDDHLNIRDRLASYEINLPSGRRKAISSQSRHTTPPPHGPPPLPGGGSGADSIHSTEPVGWAYSGLGGGFGIPGPKFPRLGGADLHSAPATRRSSMASNVHSLLNPAETAERDDEDEDETGTGVRGEERKRKRVG